MIQSLTKAMISASFLKPLKSSTEVSKHSTMGQRLEKPAHKAFWQHIHMDKSFGCLKTGVDYQSLYSPGLVRKIDKPYIRGSADAVLLVKDNGVKSAIPVEGKGKVTANTYHNTVNRFNDKHGLSDMPGLGGGAATVKSFDINDDDEHLLGLVPEHHDLFQVLHHACTYDVDQC